MSVEVESQVSTKSVVSSAMKPMRPPATPLVTHDPYFSAWSFSDRLTDGFAKHWTGADHVMIGMVRMDGVAYRFAGPGSLPVMEQTRLEVLPTRTVYIFTAGGIELTLTCVTPTFAEDCDSVSRPLSYVVFDVRSRDDRGHDVAIYFDLGAEWSVDVAGQAVEWGRHRVGDLDLLRVGSVSQDVLGRTGDNLRIDWGYLYVAAQRQAGTTQHVGPLEARDTFAATGQLPRDDDLEMPRRVNTGWPVLATCFDIGRVESGTPQSRFLMLAYDDRFGIEHMHQRLRPYWRRGGEGTRELLLRAAADYPAIVERCTTFDNAMMATLGTAGGEQYAQLCALAYRQCLAAHKLVAATDGSPLYFSKENFSNGCIATVDVTYPSAPFFLLLNPKLLAAQLTPVLDYAMSGRWKFPFAPHDLGTYPIANGQVYGGGERTEKDQMPVEECGNMLILVAALARAEDDRAAAYARPYQVMLQKWATYLLEHGYDPDNQLCTDDFAGHLARNVNLSLKAIVGLGCYARLCEAWGEAAEATEIRGKARTLAQRLIVDARDGDHLALAFGSSGTWSQKYNLIWDRLLQLDLFPPEVAENELAFYRQQQLQYGLPLDGRKAYTKLDWIAWSACLTGQRDDFDALMNPVYDWVNQTTARVPMTDWYWADSGKQAGFQARSVVGGLFIKALMDKWSTPSA